MGDNSKPSASASSLIVGIEIEKLFGRYDYEIIVPRTPDNTISRVSILYGDNGTGKTTILNLLFHLLSPAENRGHRTFIAHVPFHRFALTFADGTTIEVVREKTDSAGAFTIRFNREQGGPLEAKFNVNESNAFTSAAVTPDTELVLQTLAKLGRTIFFLGDDRMLQSDQFPELRTTSELGHIRELEQRADIGIPNLRDVALSQSLERTKTWLADRTMRASTQGDVDAQQIYAGIIREISKYGVPKKVNYDDERQKLIKAVKDLDERSRSFAEFGLVSRVESKRFVKGLNDTGYEGLKFVEQIVSSFINSQKARLDALEDLNIRLHRFVNLINRFFLDKSITLDAHDPHKRISIVTDSGSLLEPQNLSSGEKQLLLLFCNVLTSGEFGSLFLIDEPEISLNVKWQRQLVDSIIDLTRGSQCQFILASHSLELLAKHSTQVIKLAPGS